MRILPRVLAVAVLLGAASSHVDGTPLKTPGKAVRVAIVLYEGVQVLDVAGPLEVFTSSTVERDGRSDRAFDAYMVAERLEPVKANNTGKVYVPQVHLERRASPQNTDRARGRDDERGGQPATDRCDPPMVEKD